MNDVAVADAHIDEALKSELQEITFGEVADGNDTDEVAVGVGYGHGLQFALTHDFAEVTERIVLTDDGFAFKRNVLDARIQIGKEQRLRDFEIFQRVFGLVVDFAATGRHGIDAASLFEVRVADCRANRIRVGIAMPDDVNWFIAAFH